MKMKKMVLSVKDSEGNDLYKKDPANPDLCMYAFALFGDVGNHIDVDIVEVEENVENSSVS